MPIRTEGKEQFRLKASVLKVNGGSGQEPTIHVFARDEKVCKTCPKIQAIPASHFLVVEIVERHICMQCFF